MRFKGLGRQGQLDQGFALAGLDFGGGIRGATTQNAQRQAVGVLQQLALPCTPDLGAGATNVGHGEQIQGRQLALVAHTFGKGANHIGIGQILLLCHLTHGQMFSYQKLDQVGVGFLDLVGAAKALDLHGTDDGVIAATALADVVEQRRQIQNPGLVPACGQLGAERVFMRMFGHEKAPHIAQHHQDMLVHGVDME